MMLCRFLSVCMCVQLPSCVQPCDPMDRSQPGSFIHGILQATILEWVAISSSRGSSQPRDQTHISYVSCTGRQILYHSQQTVAILREMGIPDHFTCLLRSLYAGEEATVRTGHGTVDWLKTRIEIRQGCILSPYLLNFYAECIM